MGRQAQLAVDAADMVLQSSKPYTSIGLYREGVIPDASQALQAQGIARDLGSELDSVDAAIRRLHALRETLEVRLQFTRAYLASVRRLPLELLSDIFIYSVVGQEDPTMIALTTLSHVCSSWRTAVWSTPELWTHISAPKSAPLELISTEVSLSGQRPLSVDSRLIRNCQSLKSVLAELLPHAARWRETYLEGNCRNYAPISPPDFRILYSASIYLTSPFFQNDKPLKFLARASELRELALIIALKVGESSALPEILGLPPLHLTKLSLRLGYRFDGPI
ncbi:uncharacterized protein SCHCODRAFT_01118157, partial [Schizophyllum commune H4-8]|uniref:uncharacterized protein n=1 Tax=Schizophyllum commune (strain H4-8 / FGSC 9210) TaxID=578458 RepID=UPI00215F155C